MSNKSEEYLPLVGDDSIHAEQECHCDRKKPAMSLRGRLRNNAPLLLVIALQSFCLLILSIVLVRKDGTQCQNTIPTTASSHGSWPSRMWSPAQDILQNQVKVFVDGFYEKTVYQEVSDASDEAWEDLYNRTMMRIPKSEAALLPNKTYPIKEVPGYYIAQLDVFHQLHCLNKIRQALHKDRYWSILEDPESHLGDEHISHCVDSVRQYMMCNADISVIPWQWDKEDKVVRPRLEYPHKCVNFEKLREWVEERHIDEYIDPMVYVDDELPTPEIVH